MTFVRVFDAHLAGVPFLDDSDPNWEIGRNLSGSESTGSLGKVRHDERGWWRRVGVWETYGEVSIAVLQLCKKVVPCAG
jgi:hypothetical protein